MKNAAGVERPVSVHVIRQAELALVVVVVFAVICGGLSIGMFRMPGPLAYLDSKVAEAIAGVTGLVVAGMILRKFGIEVK